MKPTFRDFKEEKGENDRIVHYQQPQVHGSPRSRQELRSNRSPNEEGNR